MNERRFLRPANFLPFALGLAVLGGEVAWALPSGRFGPDRWVAAAPAGCLLLLLVFGRRPSFTAVPIAVLAAFAVFVGALDLALFRGDPRALFVLAAAAVSLAVAVLLVVVLGGSDGAARALLLAFGIALGAALAEGAVSAVVPADVYTIVPDEPDSPPCIAKGDDGVTYLTPGFRGEYRHPEFPGLRVEINSWGMRDDEDECRPVAEEEASVLVLGDSLVFGTGVPLEDTFHERLERRAARLAPGRTLRVFGAGVPGHGQVHAERMLERLAPLTRPDVVVVSVYEGNDFTDNMLLEGRRLGRVPSVAEMKERAQRERRRGGPETVRFLRALGTWRFWLGTSSLLQVVLPSIEDRLVAWGLIDPIVPSNRFLSAMLKRHPPDWVRLGLRHLEIVLGRLEQETRKVGARMLVLLIPAAVQAEPERFERFLETRHARGREAFDRRAFHDEVRKRLEDRGFRVVDPIDALERAARQGERPYLHEGHLSRRGHEILADALEGPLRALLAGS